MNTDNPVERRVMEIVAENTRLTEQLADKEKDRQYHMDAINRLGSFLALSGTSFEVVQAAIDNLTRLAKELREFRNDWNGKERRCDHEMKWISDWYGDPEVIGGTADCSRLECSLCNWVDQNGERPEPDYYQDAE